MRVRQPPQLEFIYAGTQAKLNDQVAKKIAEGWERLGHIIPVQVDWTRTNIEVPKFVYFSQAVVKGNFPCCGFESPSQPRLFGVR